MPLFDVKVRCAAFETWKVEASSRAEAAASFRDGKCLRDEHDDGTVAKEVIYVKNSEDR